MKERLKIAQIGICHEHASGKIVALKRLPEVFEIVGVVNDIETSKTPRCGNPNLDFYKDLRWMTEEEVLNLPDLDAVVVEVPNNDLVSGRSPLHGAQSAHAHGQARRRGSRALQKTA